MPRVHTGWVSAAASTAMFGFGIVMALLGAILPVLSERLHFDLARGGDLFLAMNAAMLATSVVLGPALDRFGLKIAMILAPLFTASAVALVSDVQLYSVLLFSVVLLGAGGGALNQAANTVIADLHHDPRRKNAALNLLGVFFGFGALFVPLTIGSLLAAVGLEKILAFAAILSLVPAFIAAAVGFPPPRQPSGLPSKRVLLLLREPLVLAFGVLLFFESGNEFTLGGYITSFLIRDLKSPVSSAAYVLAAYWGAIVLGRAILSRLLLRARGERLILISAVGVFISLGAFVFAPAIPQAVAAAIFLGLSIAAIFPTVLGLAGARYPSHSGTVFGILIGIALSGGMTIPWLVGRIAAAYGIRAGFSITAFGALAIFILQIASGKLRPRPLP